MLPELNDNLQFSLVESVGILVIFQQFWRCIERENGEILLIFQQFCSFRHVTLSYSAKTLFVRRTCWKKNGWYLYFFLFYLILFSQKGDSPYWRASHSYQCFQLLIEIQLSLNLLKRLSFISLNKQLSQYILYEFFKLFFWK